ncbi:MAG: ELKS/Rab6-interacting/CAST family protein [Holosporaceae bacterium]|jgi:hypothetical protein|nr:ELKS/Rab6-interacting/CAST family protein [Holosporaceae bacterium]
MRKRLKLCTVFSSLVAVSCISDGVIETANALGREPNTAAVAKNNASVLKKVGRPSLKRKVPPIVVESAHEEEHAEGAQEDTHATESAHEKTHDATESAHEETHDEGESEHRDVHATEAETPSNNQKNTIKTVEDFKEKLEEYFDGKLTQEIIGYICKTGDLKTAVARFESVMENIRDGELDAVVPTFAEKYKLKEKKDARDTFANLQSIVLKKTEVIEKTEIHEKTSVADTADESADKNVVNDEAASLKVVRNPKTLEDVKNNLIIYHSVVLPEHKKDANELVEQIKEIEKASPNAEKLKKISSLVDRCNSIPEFSCFEKIPENEITAVKLNELKQRLSEWFKLLEDTKDSVIVDTVEEIKASLQRKIEQVGHDKKDLHWLIEIVEERIESVRKEFFVDGQEGKFDSLHTQFETTERKSDSKLSFWEILEVINELKYIHDSMVDLRFGIQIIDQRALLTFGTNVLVEYVHRLIDILEEIKNDFHPDNEKEFISSTEKCIKTLNSLKTAIEKAKDSKTQQIKTNAIVAALKKLQEQFENRVSPDEDYSDHLKKLKVLIENGGELAAILASINKR